MEFNPREISYVDLLKHFWASHNPRYNGSRRQYRNAIFFLNAAQRAAAQQSRAQLAATLGVSIKTDIAPAVQFFPAEDSHQKYYLRRNDKMLAAFRRIYPDSKQFVASTAAARVNGYLGCYGQAEDLEREIGRLGLSHEMQQWLIDELAASCSGFYGVTCPAPE